MSNKEKILDLLNYCTEPQQMVFKRFYSHNDLNRSLEEIVGGMINIQINRGMEQVEKTVEKNKNRRDLKLKKIMRNYENKKRVCK